ncbi:DUF3888 domain-containing protein [Priestia megaterium]
MKKHILLIYVAIILILSPDFSFATERPQTSQKTVSRALLEEVLFQTLSSKEKVQFMNKVKSKQMLKKELINWLTGEISAVIGGDWNRGHEKILEIKKENNQSYIIVVQVISFDGPHNPPYVEETISFKTKGYRVEPIDYFNREIPEKDWQKINLW